MATLAEPAVTPAVATRHSWIGNREVAGNAGLLAIVNPSTASPFAATSLLDSGQAASAVSAAAESFPGWRRSSFHDRGRLLLRARDVILRRAPLIAGLIEACQGKPAAEAHAVEIFPALETLEHLAAEAGEVLREEPVESRVVLLAHKTCGIRHVPYGVVLVITPWNYPFFLSVSGVASALAAGNTVVLKPAPATMPVGLEIGAIFREAGFPDGVVNVVSVPDALAPGIVEDARLGKILFIGSAATGRRVMASAAKAPTPVLLELGAKDPAIVCRDADLDRAAQGVVWGAFVNAGQTCVSVERAYVEAPVAEVFIAKVVEATRKLRVGNPATAQVDMGPLTMERQLRVVEEHVADALAHGATALTGGARLSGPGFFYPPTVLTGVNHSMRVMREETFGPVLPIMAVASLDEAIRLANDGDCALTASGWTRDAAVARRLQDELSAGVVTINDCVSSLGEPSAPYGGFRQSGFGRAHGAAGLREMAQVKYVTRDASRKPMLWWYPYDAAYRLLMETAERALHSSSAFTRMRNQLSLAGSSRFWRRVNPLSLLRNVDKLF
jgi:acyl-CoA reductase-like NAD-dependent aldehyde dehydrogenase